MYLSFYTLNQYLSYEDNLLFFYITLNCKIIHNSFKYSILLLLLLLTLSDFCNNNMVSGLYTLGKATQNN